MNVMCGFRTTMAVTIAATVATPSLAEGIFGTAAQVEDARLADVTGRTDLLLLNQTKQAAAVSDSSVIGNSLTGTVNISDNAFQNLSGLSIVNANTGNNVAINSSMQVNVYLSATR